MADRARWVALAAYLALGCLPLVDQGFFLTMCTKVLLLGLMAVSLDLLVGLAGVTSLGHACFFGAGAYATAIALDHHAHGRLRVLGPELPVWATLLISILAAAALAALIGAIVARTSGMHFIMATLAFGQALQQLLLTNDFYASSGGDNGLQLQKDPILSIAGARPLLLEEKTHFYWFVWGVIGVALVGVARLRRSRLGAALAGIRENEARMMALGYRTAYLRWIAFVAAGGIAGLAGSLFASFIDYVHPSMLTWEKSGDCLMMIAIGSRGAVTGPLVGAAVYTGLEQLSVYTRWWEAIVGSVLIAITLVRREAVLPFVLRVVSRARGGR